MFNGINPRLMPFQTIRDYVVDLLPSVCVKRTSSFGVDERRCKRGMITMCYYLFVGRLVTRVSRARGETRVRETGVWW